MMTTLQKTIEQAREIRIVSGEGEVGTVERYTGKRTLRAVKARLTRERCGGQRFAHAEYLRGNGQFDRLPI